MYESKIVVFVASKGVKPRGVGKTLLMTESVYKDYMNNGRKVIANYHLYFPEIEGVEKPIYKPYRDIIDFPDDLYDANVCLDEIFIGGNARRFMSNDNVKLIEFLTQIRKRRCDVFITAQTARQLDVGIRDQVDIIVEMKKRKDDEGKEIPLFFDTIVRDRHDWDNETNVLNKFIYDGRETASLDLYDTNEIITKEGSKQESNEEVEKEVK